MSWAQEAACGRQPEGSLSSLIAGEVIPRLLLNHALPRESARLRRESQAEPALSPAEVERFCKLPLTLEADELLAEIERFLARGLCAETIFVELLAPAARRLGELWEQDLCDFIEVTMGLWRLQEVLRITAMEASPAAIFPAQRAALFSTMPGDGHSFGAHMIDEVFTRAGWHSEVLIDPARAVLLDFVAERALDLVGLTLSVDCPSARLSECIASLRGVSKNRHLQVIVGGAMVNSDRGLAARVGADGTAPDARTALVLAERLVMGSRPLALG